METEDIAVLGGLAVVSYVVVSGFKGLQSAIDEAFSIPMRAADESLGVVEAATDAGESLFSVPETVFNGISAGLQSGGEAAGGAAGGTFDFATSLPGNVYDGATGAVSGATETVSGAIDSLNPFN